MTADQDLERSLPPPAGLFRVAGHVVVVRSGSALALLDLERGWFFATTPEAEEAWRSLVEGRKADAQVQGAGADTLASLADFLLHGRLIEPRPVEQGSCEEGEGRVSGP